MTFFLPPLRTDEDAEFRLRFIENINTQIFYLVYHGHFNYRDCESMTSVELRWFYHKLLEQKEAENKAQEEALQAAKEARQAANDAQNYRRPIRGRR